MALADRISSLGSQFSQGEQVSRERRASEGISRMFQDPTLTPEEQVRQTGIEYGKAGFGGKASTLVGQAEQMRQAPMASKSASATQRLNILKTVGPMLGQAFKESPEKAQVVLDTLLASGIGGEIQPILEMMAGQEIALDDDSKVVLDKGRDPETDTTTYKVVKLKPGETYQSGLKPLTQTATEEQDTAEKTAKLKKETALETELQKKRINFSENVKKETEGDREVVAIANEAIAFLENANNPVADVGTKYLAARSYEPGGRLSDKEIELFAGVPSLANLAKRAYNKYINGEQFTSDDRDAFKEFFKMRKALTQIGQNMKVIAEIKRETDNMIAEGSSVTYQDMANRVSTMINPVNGMIARFETMEDMEKYADVLKLFSGAKFSVGGKIKTIK